MKENKNNPIPKYRTTKVPLNSILRNNNEFKEKLFFLVSEMNSLVIDSLHFLRLYILDLYRKKEDLSKINETFITYVLKTLCFKEKTCGKKPSDPELKNKLSQFYDKEFKDLIDHKQISSLNRGQILGYLSTQISTCLENNIQERYIQYLQRFINKTTQEITKDKGILRILKNEILYNKPISNDIFKSWVDEYLNHIIPSQIEKSIHYDLKKNKMNYLRPMLFMNSILESKKYKLFQPIPLRNNIIPKHIILDTVSLIKLFFNPDLKKEKEEREKDLPKTKKIYNKEPRTKEQKDKEQKEKNILRNVVQNQELIWDKYFNLNKKVFRKNKQYTFDYQIQTDGISCSLLFIRKDLMGKKYGKTSKDPKEEDPYKNFEHLSPKELEELKTKKIIACDPGKHSLVFLIDETGKKLQYTAAQRRMESLSKRNSMILNYNKKKQKIQKFESKISKNNSKTVDFEKFKTYIQEKHELNSKVKEFYEKETWRKMKFRKYCYGNRSIDNFLNRIEKTYGNEIVIAYGNWSRTTQMKGIMSTMGKGLRKLIHKKFETISVDEFNTSKKCSKCHKDLEHYIKETKKKKKIEHRLLICRGCLSSENKNKTFWNRDVNASVNILNIAKSLVFKNERPLAFRRISFEDLISEPKEIKKKTIRTKIKSKTDPKRRKKPMIL